MKDSSTSLRPVQDSYLRTVLPKKRSIGIVNACLLHGSLRVLLPMVPAYRDMGFIRPSVWFTLGREDDRSA
jgi:hypothetical protein